MAENPQALHAAARMQALGWNQTDLAREAGVDEGTISDFLAHKRRPRRGTIGRIEAALGVTPGTLGATGEDPPAKAPSEMSEAELVQALTLTMDRLKRERDAAMLEVQKWKARAEEGAAPATIDQLRARRQQPPPGVERMAANHGDHRELEGLDAEMDAAGEESQDGGAEVDE